jgi:hypothetical protein
VRRPSLEHDLLAIYLRDHHAGAVAGASLARRLARSASPDIAGADDLARIAREIEEDLRTLEDVMEAEGIEPSRAKDALLAAAERGGRLKLNGRLASRSPLSDVLEAEGVIAGITGKERMWIALDAAGTRADVDLGRLVSRARSQRAAVARFHEAASQRALARAGSVSARAAAVRVEV